MAMEVIRGRAHGAYTRTPARWAALVLCLCPALGARIRSVASVPGVRPVARCSAFACTSLSEQHSPAARASKHSLAGVEETPEQLREIIHALFGSESSKRAFSRDMIAKQSAKRDYPDEMGNRFTCARHFTTLALCIPTHNACPHSHVRGTSPHACP